MKFSIIVFCLAGLVLAGCAKHHADMTGESWLSGPQLESRLRPIAEAYAKQHKIAFDFSGAHCRIQIFTGGSTGGSPICGDIFFDHGLGKLGLDMMIDHSGKIIQAWTVVPQEGLQPQPNKSPEPTAVGAGSSAIAVHVASRRWLSFLR